MLMNKQRRTTLLKFLLIAPITYFAIRIITVFTLWFKYGESNSGSEQSEEVFNFFLIRHFPLVLLILVLTIWTVNKTEKLKFHAGLLTIGVVLYFILERLLPI